MLKFGRKLTRSKQSKDESDVSKEQPLVKKGRETDDIFDERLSKVFENGISLPVGPDGRIHQSETEVFARSSSVRPATRASAMDSLNQRSASSGRAQRQRNHFYENDHSQGSHSKEGNNHDSLPNLAFHPYDSKDRHSSRERSGSRTRSRGRGENTWHARSIDSKDFVDKTKGGEKKRKSKMEKIQQLQAKNDLYKEEFKRVQRDRKQMKKDIEFKKKEITSLTNEIDAHIAETSILKLKLSEALQQLDRTDLGTRKDQSTLIKFNRELTQAQNELEDAQEHIANLRQEILNLQNESRRKNQQIESLSVEVAKRSELVESLQNENQTLQRFGSFKPDPRARSNDTERIKQLETDNETLQVELGETLERAATMVKEREDAIADLLKENDEIKRQSKTAGTIAGHAAVTEAQLTELKDELHLAHATLEDAQDRNVMLEEELESMMKRGNELNQQVRELKEDLETMEERASSTKETIEIVEESASQARKEADSARKELLVLKLRHKDEMEQLKAEMKEQREQGNTTNPASMVPNLMESSHDDDSDDNSNSDEDAQTRQARLLEEAVANRRNKTGAAKKGWLVGLGLVEEEELSEDQKRIKELEEENASQQKEISSLRSELVRLRSTYNDTMYTNKKTIEVLETENEAHLVKVQALEVALTQAEV